MAEPLATTFELREWSVVWAFVKRGAIGGGRGESSGGLQNVGHLKGIRLPVGCGMKLPSWLDLLV